MTYEINPRTGDMVLRSSKTADVKNINGVKYGVTDNGAVVGEHTTLTKTEAAIRSGIADNRATNSSANAFGRTYGVSAEGGMRNGAGTLTHDEAARRIALSDRRGGSDGAGRGGPQKEKSTGRLAGPV